MFPIHKNFSEIISKRPARIALIALALIGMIILRRAVGVFGVSLGYLYVTIIAVAGLWFGKTGGLVVAFVSVLIFIGEVAVFRGWQARDLVFRGMPVRVIVYFLSGLALGHVSDEEKKMRKRLEFLAGHDELTGCLNFRWMMEFLEKEFARSKRYQKKMAVAIVDIDFFKRINDTYGHLVGNDVLQLLSKILKDNVRNEDTVARYGGEEFLIIFPESSSPQALVVLERIKAKLAEQEITSAHLKAGEKVTVTFSAGIACYPDNSDDLSKLLNCADTALYKAKNSGRNCIFY
ncbi:MAG: GGDEF domain-containing protein [Candidatus Omnitrophica bacterium]|nr:GGDEF domain-containing protein [Candidatus Omnitrophota bacterium]